VTLAASEGEKGGAYHCHVHVIDVKLQHRRISSGAGRHAAKAGDEPCQEMGQGCCAPTRQHRRAESWLTVKGIFSHLSDALRAMVIGPALTSANVSLATLTVSPSPSRKNWTELRTTAKEGESIRSQVQHALMHVKEQRQQSGNHRARWGVWLRQSSPRHVAQQDHNVVKPRHSLGTRPRPRLCGICSLPLSLPPPVPLPCFPTPCANSTLVFLCDRQRSAVESCDGPLNPNLQTSLSLQQIPPRFYGPMMRGRYEPRIP
jgi:hypothetical protein